MKAVLWAFLGVRKKAGLQDDVASISFVHIIIAVSYTHLTLPTNREV